MAQAPRATLPFPFECWCTHLTLLACLPAPPQANIHSDGRYGFIEFRSAEFATAALELNGQINLMNQSLSIGRPASYVDPNKVRRGGGDWCTCRQRPAVCSL